GRDGARRDRSRTIPDHRRRDPRCGRGARPRRRRRGDRNRKSDLSDGGEMRRLITATFAVGALVLAGWASSDPTTPTSSAAAGSKPNLTVSAAASLKEAFTRYGAQFPAASTRFSFAGSDMLAAQIEQGVKPDVFASANTKLPTTLYRKGLVDKPVVF